MTPVIVNAMPTWDKCTSFEGRAGAAQVGRRNWLGHTDAASVTIAFRDQYKKKSAPKVIGMAIAEMRISERRKKVTDGTDALRPPILVAG
jgi:hypothetical protein